MGYKANIASNLLNQLLRLVVGALTGILVARVLGPQGLGRVTYILLIFTLIGDYGHLGLNNAVMYFKKRRVSDLSRLYSVNVTALLLLFLVIAGVMLLFRGAGLALSGYHPLYILGGLLFVVSDLIFTNNHSWFIGDERIPESNRLIIISFFAKSAALLLLWLGGLLTQAAYFAVICLAMLLNALLLHLRLGRKFRPSFDLPLLKAEFSYGSVIWVGAAFAFLHYRADQIMIRHMLGVSELGVYSVAVVLAELMFLVPMSINSALLGKLYNTDDPAASRRLMVQTLKLSFYVCLGLALAGIPLSLLIPVFYGAPYASAVPGTMILLTGVVFATLAKVSAQYFFAQGRPVFHLAATGGTLLLNVVLNWFLIPVWGITGAAVASSVSYLCYGAFYLSLFLTREGFTFNELFVLRFSELRALLPGKRA